MSSPDTSFSSEKRTAGSSGQYPTYEEMLQQRIEEQQRHYFRRIRRRRGSLRNVICANVPLPPQTYDEPSTEWMDYCSDWFSTCFPSTSTGLRSGTPEIAFDMSLSAWSSSDDEDEIPIPRRLEYPKPAIPFSYEHLYLGANKTLIPWFFYVDVPWHSYELSTRRLINYIFGEEMMSTHTVHGTKQLDRSIVEDIVTHVSERCSIGEEYVVFVMAKRCSECAKLAKDGLLGTRATENYN